jgi:hypothetical protein
MSPRDLESAKAEAVADYKCRLSHSVRFRDAVTRVGIEIIGRHVLAFSR